MVDAPVKIEGIHRGVVVSADDPQRMNRYRVFIHGFHTFKSDRHEFAFRSDGSVFDRDVDGDAFLTYGTREIHDLRDVADSIALADPSAFDPYPWAEVTGGGFQSGMHPSYRVPDKVWIMFERGDPAHPVIIGGIADITDVPAIKAQGDYDELDALLVDEGPTGSGTPSMASGVHASFVDHELRARKWMIRGRIGGSVVVSESYDEAWVRLSSGGASLTFAQSDDSLYAEARGMARFRVGDFEVQSNKSHFISRGSHVVEVRGRAGSGGTEGMIAMYSDYEMDLFAHTSIAIGQYVDRLLVLNGDPCHRVEDVTCAAPSASPGAQARDVVRQSRMAWMGPKLLQLGIGCPQEMYRRGHYVRRPTDNVADRSSGTFGMYRPTISTRIEATHELVIWCNGHWQPDATCDPITGGASSGTVAAAASSNGAVKGPVGFMMLRATGPNSRYGEVDLACESDGTLSIIEKRDGTIVLWADSKIVINAPEVVIRTAAGEQKF